jgi:hypothetical protein
VVRPFCLSLPGTQILGCLAARGNTCVQSLRNQVEASLNSLPIHHSVGMHQASLNAPFAKAMRCCLLDCLQFKTL